jgi:V8-like Glu-specific endopeptidase
LPRILDHSGSVSPFNALRCSGWLTPPTTTGGSIACRNAMVASYAPIGKSAAKTGRSNFRTLRQGAVVFAEVDVARDGDAPEAGRVSGLADRSSPRLKNASTAERLILDPHAALLVQFTRHVESAGTERGRAAVTHRRSMLDRLQIDQTRQRFDARTAARTLKTKLIDAGRIFEADSPGRVEQFLLRRGLVSPPDSDRRRIVPTRADITPESLERILGENDLQPVSFFARGLRVAHTVTRVWVVDDGQRLRYGTGFMISPRLLMTNNHVLESKNVARGATAEFNYQLDHAGALSASKAFRLAPDELFITDEHLDYTIVAVRPTADDGTAVASFGWNKIVEDQGKVITGQFLNIIQHPNGEPKQISVRANQLKDILDDFLHYHTDTAPGSSGAPVFNDLWEVVALHHSGVWRTNAAGQILAIGGGVWTEAMGEHRIDWEANEGARISRIIAHARGQVMSEVERNLLHQALNGPPPGESANATNAVATSSSNAPAVASAHDGSATWTIPLSVSVRVGAAAAPTVVAGAVVGSSPPSSTTTVDSAAPPTDEQILAAARAEFGRRADVLDVELGYVFRDEWITDEPAIVVTVRKKVSIEALRRAHVSALPERLMGLPVEVQGPGLSDLLRARPGASLESLIHQDEIRSEEIQYVPPANAELSEVEADMRVVAHLGPDAGWPRLQEFLQQTQRRLVVGMYDFGAPHIVETVESLPLEELKLTMQYGESIGEGTKKDDLPDDEVVDRLRSTFNDKFEFAWVKTGPVNGWIAYSYHVKIAIRDRAAFWLSSGNWQSSNQPPGTPPTQAADQRDWLRTYNREWHVIVHHPDLARTFERYLLHDLTRNATFQPTEFATVLPDVFVPEAFLRSAREFAQDAKFFPVFDETRGFRVQPLLSPDNYHQHVLELIRSATETLWIQNQTFNAPNENNEKLDELVGAVLAKQQEGVDVRIIFRKFFPRDTRANLTALKRYGLRASNIKVQANCHTKGIIVDRRRVLIGSHNWSESGVSTNRDASLLFQDPGLARYFAEIFEHDWNKIATRSIGNEALAIELAAPDQPTPPGMVRLDAKDYLELR